MKTPFPLHRWTLFAALFCSGLLCPITTASAQVTAGRYVGTMKITTATKGLKTSLTVKVQAWTDSVELLILTVPDQSVEAPAQTYAIPNLNIPVLVKNGESSNQPVEVTEKGKHLKIFGESVTGGGSNQWLVNLVRKGE